MFRHLSHRIMAVVGLAVTLGLAVTTWFYTRQQELAVRAQNERTLGTLAETAIQGLESLALAGYADIAQDYADHLKRVPGIADFRILRTDGSEAFRDNRTIHDVNRRRGDSAFRPRERETRVEVLAAADPLLDRILRSEQKASMRGHDAARGGYITFLAPILNRESCHTCHGAEERVRGVVKLTASLAPVEHEIGFARQQSLVMAGMALIVTLVLTGYLISRTVSRPVRTVTEAMTRAAAGDLSQRVPSAGNDEIAHMAESFNRMGTQLARSYGGLKREQDKLTTIIRSADEGIVVTDGAGDVVLVNPAAELLLGKSADIVRHQGFNHLFDAPEDMQRRMEAPAGGTEHIHFGERILSLQVSTIRDPEGSVVGSAALFRDVTEEKRLENELRRLSVTDPLTGLYNRRYLDENLAREFDRSRRHRLPLSVIMCDVDHFKRYNDRHGHERGDRVLQTVARLMLAALRTHDLPCRYGGEEFLAVLPSTAQGGALAMAERLRRDIAEADMDAERVTVSIGVASFPQFGADSPQALVEAADRALYEAKRAGRNQVRAAGPAA
ncbi:MAG TPA: diguanylate cyclase [Burkholderiales bacterium]|nr:diguanylate cyclase [Burkholderiales bacterium]